MQSMKTREERGDGRLRLLIFAVNYAPEVTGTAPYTTAFAEHMAGQGHDVHVVTGFPHYPSRALYAAEHGEISEIPGKGVRVHRRQHYAPVEPAAIRRAFYEASFLLSGASALALPRPDAVLAVVPTLADGVLARLASRRFGAPYGVVLHDLMGQAVRQVGYGHRVGAQGLVRATERWIMSRARTVAIVAEGFRDYVESLGVPPERIIRVRNWNLAPPASGTRADLRARLGWPPDKLVCLHAGNMGLKQGLGNVIECARIAATRDPRLVFVLAGDGNQRSQLERESSRLGLGNLHFLPPQSSQDYADLLAAADVLLLNQSPAVKDMSLPSKIGAYVASGTPIVAAVAADSAAGSELAQAGAALIIEPGQPRKLAGAVSHAATNLSLRGRLITAAREYRRLFAADDALHALDSFVDRLMGATSQGTSVAQLRETA